MAGFHPCSVTNGLGDLLQISQDSFSPNEETIIENRVKAPFSNKILYFYNLRKTPIHFFYCGHFHFCEKPKNLGSLSKMVEFAQYKIENTLILSFKFLTK